MAKKIQGYIKLQIPAGKANPAPPIGPALGQQGVNIMEFCKAFNAATAKSQPGILTPVVITVYSDRSFTFIMKEPPVPTLLKLAAKLESAAKNPGKEIAGRVTMAQVREIAQRKMKDMNAHTLDAAVSMVRGSAVSMGLEVVG